MRCNDLPCNWSSLFEKPCTRIKMSDIDEEREKERERKIERKGERMWEKESRIEWKKNKKNKGNTLVDINNLLL